MTSEQNNREPEIELIQQVDDLNDEVKSLALNLAIYLAKAKGNSDDLSRLEPEFIRLINGSVKVVQELALIINAARDKEAVVFDVPSGLIRNDHLETKLRAILEQCNEILKTLARKTDITI